jgi:hypothetical protein
MTSAKTPGYGLSPCGAERVTADDAFPIPPVAQQRLAPIRHRQVTELSDDFLAHALLRQAGG